MKYTIRHETRDTLRIRTCHERFTRDQARWMRTSLLALPDVRDVRIYEGTGGALISYEGSREDLLAGLSALDCGRMGPVEAYPDTDPETGEPGSEEIRERKLSAHLKRKMTRRILAESVVDIAAPAPVQFAFHIWQLWSLRKY